MTAYCNCGHYTRTLAGLRRHAKKCEYAEARLRRAEDHARLDRLERAKEINDKAREGAEAAWRRALEKP